MAELTPIDAYLRQVEAYLPVDRSRRRRVLEEIEGHLVDAADARLDTGYTWEQAAQVAIRDLGPPEEVAAQFGAAPRATRVVRGWRRWAPLILPGIFLSTCVVMIAWLLMQISDGMSHGEELALRLYLTYGVILALLIVGAFVSVRRADRDRAWRAAAWSCTALSAAVLVFAVSA